ERCGRPDSSSGVSSSSRLPEPGHASGFQGLSQEFDAALREVSPDGGFAGVFAGLDRIRVLLRWTLYDPVLEPDAALPLAGKVERWAAPGPDHGFRGTSARPRRGRQRRRRFSRSATGAVPTMTPAISPSTPALPATLQPSVPISAAAAVAARKNDRWGFSS